MVGMHSRCTVRSTRARRYISKIPSGTVGNFCISTVSPQCGAMYRQKTVEATVELHVKTLYRMTFPMGRNPDNMSKTKQRSARPSHLQRLEDGVLSGHLFLQALACGLCGVCDSHALLDRAMMSELGL